MGLLGTKPLRAIVITPACDLANDKVGVITYIPVLPISEYFSTIATLPRLRRALDNKLALLQVSERFSDTARHFPPRAEELMRITEALAALESSRQLTKQEAIALEGAKAGIKIIGAIRDPELSSISPEDLSSIFGKEHQATIGQIVTNSFSSDVHFLPADLQPVKWSAVFEHSVALFRYPMVVPVEILDRANDARPADWKTIVEETAQCLPCARHFIDELPMKRATLESNYMNDLLARFASVHMRIGSPDFSSGIVSRYIDEVTSRHD